MYIFLACGQQSFTKQDKIQCNEFVQLDERQNLTQLDRVPKGCRAPGLRPNMWGSRTKISGLQSSIKFNLGLQASL